MKPSKTRKLCMTKTRTTCTEKPEVQLEHKKTIKTIKNQTSKKRTNEQIASNQKNLMRTRRINVIKITVKTYIH